ncbi:16S rRNA (guanine(527)-N(7))-methyltransferase RsmG [Sphingomonas pruni]|uniref:16S rRNA (guanine(527)-N(7))-methyltransferase RsmG n=1 Tax=Sphingomonas pruni TaxID=40683 RepID=UPI0008343F16|nr:16S rRNA (guanine(527)-N(7))-methyltransferase RsmG [Sphingomonas pruni]
MTEEEARDWATARFGAEAIGRLDHLAALVTVESDQQNLIARSTLATIWSRHIVDSLQLAPLAPDQGDWLDIGTGAGFPGLALAAAQPERRFILVEPRRLRADFLRETAATLALPQVEVVTGKVENFNQRVAVISARAVAQVTQVIASAAQCASNETLWLLPKGRSAREEVARAKQRWHGMFHVEQSITDPDSSIVIARGARAR